MSTPKKARKRGNSFRITFSYGTDTYAVIPLNPDPAEARKAFQLRKQTGDRQVYAVRLTNQGSQCNCKGFTYRQRCKHIRMLNTAKMLD